RQLDGVEQLVDRLGAAAALAVDELVHQRLDAFRALAQMADDDADQLLAAGRFHLQRQTAAAERGGELPFTVAGDDDDGELRAFHPAALDPRRAARVVG